MVKKWRNPGAKEVKDRILQATYPPQPPPPPVSAPAVPSQYTREVDRQCAGY